MKYADVILPRKLTDPLTYQIPEALSATIAPGSRVVVPLQTKLYTGIVLQVHERRPEFKLKEVVAWLIALPWLRRANSNSGSGWRAIIYVRSAR